MSEHFIEHCVCGAVLNQCRCPSPIKIARTRPGPCACSRSPVAPSGEASGDRAVADRLTAAVREADSAFEKSGGSSRHWVRDCLLPILDKHGLSLVPTSDDVKCEACAATAQWHGHFEAAKVIRALREEDCK